MCVNLQTVEFCDLRAPVLSGILTVSSLSLKFKPYNFPLDQQFSDVSAWHLLKQPIKSQLNGNKNLENAPSHF